jgi:PAS domain S-box-containing protein
MPAGKHTVPWDGKDGAVWMRAGPALAPAGEYTWRGLFHEGIGLKLRGWVANGSGAPWETVDGKGGWGGDAGVPSAVAADGRQVYLGWSLAREGKTVVACDAEQRVTFLNAAAERMLGRGEAQAKGKSLAELLGRVETGVAEVAQALARHEPAMLSFEAEATASSKSLMLQGTVAPIVHAERVLGAVLVLHDVTEQRRRDEQLALTDRLSSLGTLVASVAHELNNPLSYTLGNLGLATAELSRLKDQLQIVEVREAMERVIASLRDAEEGAGRVANTVKELRTFGRMEERSQRAVDPRACVDWAIRLTSNQLLH